MQINLRGYYLLSYQKNPFKDQITHITEEKDYYTIPDYLSQNFGMLIGETMTCLSCHKTKSPKLK